MKKGTVKKIVLGISVPIVLFILIVVANVVFLVKNESIVSKGQPIQNYGKKNCALLVVDIQEVITGGLSIYPSLQEKSDPLIRNINQVIDSFEVHHYPVIYVRSEINNPFINLVNSSYAKGSPGVQYDKRLKRVSTVEVIKTGQDAFRKTNLDEILTKNNINELYIVGLDAAECINATVKAAQHRKYAVTMVKEAVTSKSESRTDSMMVCFQNQGVRLMQLNSFHLTE